MDYEGFLLTVEREADVPRDRAEDAVRATLSTLAERVSGGEAADIARELPPELRQWIHEDRHARAQPFDAREFLRRVAEREHADPDEAARHVAAVFKALGWTISREELHDLASELPKDLKPFAAAPEGDPPPTVVHEKPRRTVSAEELIDRIAARGGLDREQARRAAVAVLETLGERISHGQVEDLAARLPEELHPPLLLGDAHSSGAARPLSLEQFLRHVAGREGVTPEEAKAQARAVFGALREVVGEKEMDDTAAQLPRDYAAILARD